MAAQPNTLCGLGTSSPTRSSRSSEPPSEELRDSLEKLQDSLEQLKTDVQQASLKLLELSTPPDSSFSGGDVLQALREMKWSGGVLKVYEMTYGITPASRVSSQIISAIDQLKAGKEDEVVPTDFAYMTACAVIQSAYSREAQTARNVPRIMPEPWVTTDDVGGIRVLWNFGSRKLRANFGARPELQTYLYYESNSELNAEPLDAELLKRRLTWLTER